MHEKNKKSEHTQRESSRDTRSEPTKLEAQKKSMRKIMRDGCIHFEAELTDNHSTFCEKR